MDLNLFYCYFNKRLSIFLIQFSRGFVLSIMILRFLVLISIFTPSFHSMTCFSHHHMLYLSSSIFPHLIFSVYSISFFSSLPVYQPIACIISHSSWMLKWKSFSLNRHRPIGSLILDYVMKSL